MPGHGDQSTEGLTEVVHLGVLGSIIDFGSMKIKTLALPSKSKTVLADPMLSKCITYKGTTIQMTADFS